MACCGNDGYSLFYKGDNRYGDKYQFDPSFKGPKSGRTPTDVVWLLIFSIFMLIWITLGIFVLTHNPNPNGFEIAVEIRSNSSDSTFEYLKQTWWYSFITILFATAICMVLIHTLRWIATPVVWASIIISIAPFFIGAIYFFIDSNYIGVGVLSLILGLIFSAVICSLRHKIIIAIALIKEGSKAIGSIYSTVFFPILPLIFQLTFMVKCVCIALSLPTFVGQDAEDLCRLLQLFNFLGCLWVFLFIQAFQTLVLSRTFAAWYWTLNKEEVSSFILTSAVVRTTRFHLGTAALGSVLIAAVRVFCYMIRILTIYRYTRFLRLFSEHIELILKFWSTNAFIIVAIHSQPFFESMRDAFNLLMRNIVSVYVVDRVTTFLFVLFSILVAVGMGCLTYYCLPMDSTSDIKIMMVPVLISGFGSLLVASAFFGVYLMAIDTLFLCFLEDCERNDGSELRPYYMSRSLMEVLHKNSDSLNPTN